ncbi:MAG: phosphoenolpyruvate mutase [Acetivibrio sp.]
MKKEQEETKKTVYMSFSTDMLHYGHMMMIQKAASLGNLIVGVLTDEVIAQYKKAPLISFSNRFKMFENLDTVSRVIKKDELSYQNIILQYHPDYIVHGDDWRTGIKSGIRRELLQLLETHGGELIEFPYNADESINILEKSFVSRYSMPEVRRGMLRRLLKLKPYIRVMEAHDGLTGLIVEQTQYEDENRIVEFDAMWESSLCDSASRGKPDIELIDWSARIDRINEIMEVTTKPIIVDGDTGGLAEHLVYNVQTLERIGVSAIIIEDKIGAKRNSLFGTDVAQTQDKPEHFAKKIATAKAALKTKEFMIIARIESLILKKGIEDAVERGYCYIEAGADGLMIHSKEKNPDEIYKFCEIIRKKYPDIPIVAVPTTYNNIPEEQLANHGINIIIHANHLLRSAFPAMQKTAMKILENGCSGGDTDNLCMPIKEVIRFIPVDGEE